jgi:hypothetical protein
MTKVIPKVDCKTSGSHSYAIVFRPFIVESNRAFFSPHHPLEEGTDMASMNILTGNVRLCG